MIKHIKITHMGPFDDYAVDLPMIGLIEGENGAGKSSLQRCLMYPFERGHDPNIISAGSDTGEVTITLGDGTLVRSVASRTTTKKKGGSTVREYKPKDGKAWLPAPEFLQALASSITYDPLRPRVNGKIVDIDAPDKDQVEMMLQVAPIPLEEGELRAAIGETASEVQVHSADLTASDNGLGCIDFAFDRIYEKRTDINREADVLRKHALALEQALPNDQHAAVDWQLSKAELVAAKTLVEAEQRQEAEAIKAAFHEIEVAAERALAIGNEEIDADITARMTALKAEQADRKERLRGERDTAVKYEREKMELQVSEILEKYRPPLQQFIEDIALAERNAVASQQAVVTRQNAAAANSSAMTAETRARKLTDSLDRLKALKVKVAGRMKIPGIIIDNGRICRYECNGKPVDDWKAGEPVHLDWSLVPFSAWNTASKIVFRFRLAIIARGACPFIVCDSIGDLSPETLEGVSDSCQHYAKEFGIQWIFGSAIQGGPLRITEGLLDSQVC